MSLKESIITGIATSAAMPSIYVGTCLGTLFAPSLATTSGGMGAVMSATAAGLYLAFLPTVFFSSMAALSSSPVPRVGFSILAAASFTAGIALGGAMFNLAMPSLLPCVGLGVAIAALGALITIGLTRMCLDAFVKECKETFTP